MIILGIYIGVVIGEMVCWCISGQQRYKHAKYLLPVIGGYMAVYDKLKDA